MNHYTIYMGVMNVEDSNFNMPLDAHNRIILFIGGIQTLELIMSYYVKIDWLNTLNPKTLILSP